jgi:hypothetical protein
MERRRHPRTQRPLDGTWAGASGGTACRVADISAGGCFVNTLSQPQVGEITTVTVSHDARTLLLTGLVRSVDPGIGFGVEFCDLTAETRQALSELLDALGRA